MRYEWFIAKRYLRPQGGATFIFHLTLISIAGIALGVTSLITVISVMNGFANDLRSKMMQGSSHLMLNYSHSGGLTNYEAHIPQLQSVDNVAACVPAIIYQGVLYATDMPEYRKIFASFIGLDPHYLTDETGLKNHIISGSLDELEIEQTGTPSNEKLKITELSSPKLPGIVIGKEMASLLFGVSATSSEIEKKNTFERVLGQRITLVTVPNEMDTFSTSNTRSRIFQVVGVFESGHYEFDSSWCYVSIPSAQYLLKMPKKISHYLFWFHDHRENATLTTEDTINRINRDSIGKGYSQTWMNINRVFFEALEIEKRTMDYILKIIILVATFNIIATLFMVVTEKTRDIGLLRAIGAGRRNIMMIFILLGIIVGLLGTSLGVVGGYTVCRLIQWLQLDLPGDGMIYYLKYLPCEMEISDFINVSLYTFSVSFLASIYPAVRASRFVPVEALRFS